jgi:hypothetical protein
MRFVHTTGKTWYKVLYKHTVYVISLSNISINTNFKQIRRVEIRLTNWYNTLRETTCCAWRQVCSRSFYCFVNVAHIYMFTPHSNDMTSCQSSSAENISCNVALFFYHHSVVIQHLVSDTLYQKSCIRPRLHSLNSKENVHNVR